MNRKTLFGRIASSLSAATPARPEYTNVRLEPLEDRKMLAAVTYVNDNWLFVSGYGPTLEEGDLVRSGADPGTIIVAEYGFDAFGIVSGGLSIAEFATIHSAIQNTDSNGTLNLLPGTFRESDIVIDRPMTFQGRLFNGNKVSTIVPEVVSATVQENFGAGTHSGIIVYSPTVTVKDVIINGSGNGSLPAGLHYHHGITTLYDTQNGGGYSSLRNGVLPLIHLGTLNGPDVEGQPNRPRNSVPALDYDNLAISNVYWHGATISPLFNHSFDSGNNENFNLQIRNSTITNVGDTKDVNRIGVLLQNLTDENASGGNVANTTITNVGVGVKTAPFGDNNAGTFGDSNTANNQSYIRNVTVVNPEVYGIAVYDGSRTDANRWKITHSNAANNAVGVYLNRSRSLLVGATITGLKIGVQVQNSPLSVAGGNNDRHPFIGYESYITGPAGAPVGSIGVLVNTSPSDQHSANVLLTEEFTLTGFHVGVRAEQLNAPSVTPPANGVFTGNKNMIMFSGGRFYGNGTDVVVGQNSIATGAMQNAKGFAPMSVQVIDNGELSPVMFNYDFQDPYFSNTIGNAPTNPAPNSDAHTTGSVTFGSSSTFSSLLSGDTGTRTVFDFNSLVHLPPDGPGVYPFSEPPADPVGGIVPAPYGALFSWYGSVIQDGNGQLTVGGNATNGEQYEFLFGSKNVQLPDDGDPETPLQYQLLGQDLTGDSHAILKVKLLADNQTKVFAFGILDTRGNVNAWYIDATELSSTTYTDVVINLLTPTIDLTGPDSNLDLGNIAGWLFGGDQGLANGLTTVPTRFTVDEVRTLSMINSELRVTGAVDLGGATFNGTLGAGFTPTIGQTFTIIDNDGVDPVVGTFAGVAEGGAVTIGGNTYEVSYVGGDGNDVTLERKDIVVQPPASVVGRHIFYNQSKFDGNSAGITTSVASNAAIATDKVALQFSGSTTAPVSAATSYSRGINGIIVDIEDAAGTLSVNDFTFKVGTSSTVSSWVNAPPVSGFTVWPGAGAGGSDRVEIIWANNAIQNSWLQVIVEGNDTLGGSNTNTGLATSDVFFFANKVGDTFLSPAPTIFSTAAADGLAIRANPGFLQPITNAFDMDRNQSVGAGDELIARTNGGFLTRNLNWTPPAGDDDDSGSAVASALAATSTPSLPRVPGWISGRLATVNLNSGPVAKLFTALADANTPTTRSLLLAANEVTDALGLDDSLLEELIAGLN